MPRRLGQHFLADRRVLGRIADALAPSGKDLVIEIGAGRGALTALLAERAGLVVAVEINPPLAEHLRQTFGATEAGETAGPGRVAVVEADVLGLPLASLPTRYGFSRASVAGNLPYYITSPILTRLFAAREVLDRMVVMVQFEVAQRLVARPGNRDYGSLSVTTQYFTQPELLFRIPPGAFRPPPKVDSAVVRMTPRERSAELGISDEREFLGFVGKCFARKRKTLVNNLRPEYDPARLQEALRALGAKPAARAEELSVEQLAALYRESSKLKV